MRYFVLNGVVCLVILTLFFGSVRHLEAEIINPLSDPGTSFFDLTINFDTAPSGNPIDAYDDILDQYESIGVRFRDELSFFNAPLGGSPGIAVDYESLSLPNSLKDNETSGESVFVLFETPVLAIGAFVQGDPGEIFLSAYDTSLTHQGTVSLLVNDEWKFLGFTSTTPIATVKFHSDDSVYYIDDLGFNPVPEPTTICLMGFGILGLLGIGIRQRRKNK
jgi:hypothetical protein